MFFEVAGMETAASVLFRALELFPVASMPWASSRAFVNVRSASASKRFSVQHFFDSKLVEGVHTFQ